MTKRLALVLATVFCFLLVASSRAPVSAKDTWTSVRSKNFLLLGNAGEKEIRQVGVRLEQFREVFSRLFTTLNVNSPVPTTVIVFKNDDSYRPFKPNQNTAGYFQPGSDVNYITLKLSTDLRSEQDPFTIIFHEYTHLLVRNSSGNVPPQSDWPTPSVYSPSSPKILVPEKEGIKPVKKVCLMLLFAVAAIAIANGSASAQMQMNKMDSMNPMVGGAAMLRSRDIVDNAVNSADHTTLVAAVKTAGLVETLKSKGPFTVFAPTNEAFDKLPAGTVNTLVMPENKAMLTKILTYHVLAGKFDSQAIAKRIRKGHGSAKFTTVSGDTLTASMSGNDLILRDERGGTSQVTIANVYQSNGVIHVVDSVLLPN